MNTNDAYGTNTAEIATTGNVAYMTAGDTIPATQNVAYGQVPPGTDDCYDYVVSVFVLGQRWRTIVALTHETWVDLRAYFFY